MFVWLNGRNAMVFFFAMKLLFESCHGQPVDNIEPGDTLESA